VLKRNYSSWWCFIKASTTLSVRDVSKRFGDIVAVDRVSFEAHKEILAIMGPNGSGKTTTLSMVSGVLRPSSGRILVMGIDLWGSRDEMVKARRYIGYAPQNILFRPWLSGLENLVWIGMVRALSYFDTRRRARELIERLELEDHMNKPVAKYSGGMIRRLSIASALIHDPEVLVLDEPSSGLDPKGLEALWSLLLKIASGKTLIYSTHNPYEAERFSSRVLIMHKGKIVASGIAEELIKTYCPNPSIAVYLPDGAKPLILDGYRGFDEKSSIAIYEARDPHGDLESIVAAYTRRGIIPIRVEVRRSGLGEVFIRITKTPLEEAE